MRPSEYFRLLYQTFFKGPSLDAAVQQWSRKKRLTVSLWAGAYNFLFAAGILFILQGGAILFESALEVAVGVALGVASGVAFGVAFGVVFGVALGVAAGVGYGVAGGVAFGVALGVVYGVAFGATFGAAFGVAVGVAFGVAAGVFVGVPYGVSAGVATEVSYFLVTLRPFYWPWYMTGDLVRPRNPLRWDENIGFPIPLLANLLQRNAIQYDTKATVTFAQFLLQERPVQKAQAQKGLVLIATDLMLGFRTLEEIGELPIRLSFMPDPDAISETYTHSYQALSRISRDLALALTDSNRSNQLRALKGIKINLEAFQKEMNFSSARYSNRFAKVANSWQKIVTVSVEDLRSTGGFPLPNPFVTGSAIQSGGSTFVGRTDIIDQIKTESLREGQSGAILFRGNRRTGKSSTLNNMASHLPSSLVVVNIDGQAPEVRQMEDFCTYLSVKLAGVSPQLSPSDKLNLSQLSHYLQAVDEALADSGKTLLICIDEYERLGPRIQTGQLDGLADSLRYWIQHLQHIVFLFAGSHDLTALSDIDWTDYLINVRTVPISFLDEASALRLVSRPIPEYELTYTEPDLPQQLIRRLGRQPYLIQVTMFELTELLNQDGHRKLATSADIDKAIRKMLVSASQYFQHVWHTELGEDARAVVQVLAQEQALDPKDPQLRKLERMEIVRQDSQKQWVFCVPVFIEWLRAEGEI